MAPVTWPRRLIVGALLPLAITGALVLSASATVRLATDAGVGPQVAPFAVGMLEVAALAGTLLWVLVERRTLRRDAVLVTLASSGVSMVAGAHAYGWFGLVGPVALVLVVHLASRAWREDWTEDEPGSVAELVAERELTTEPCQFEPPDVPGVNPATVVAAAELFGREPATGRPRLIAELGVTDHQARKLLKALRPLTVAS